jgi:hypothetical protein
MFTYTPPTVRESVIHTPPTVCEWLYQLTKHIKPNWILDPCVGGGNMINPWFKSRIQYFLGIDPEPDTDIQDARYMQLVCSFESIEKQHINIAYKQTPPLVLANPPWRGHWGRKHFPEIFLRKCVELFGTKVPIIMCVPMGTTLNLTKSSKRYSWLRDSGPQITSVISVPRDLYPGIQFHTQILLFNIKRVKPHYFLPDEVMV